MFYFYAIGSMLGYSLQQTLLVHHARKIDGLSLVFYRNISFVITLLPLLIGASNEDIRAVLAHWQMLMISGFAGAFFLALIFLSYKFLTAGISSTISMAISNIMMVILGWLFLSEVLSGVSILLIGVILTGTVLLGLQHAHMPHLDSRFALGITIVIIGSLPVAYVKFVLAILSRQTSPLVAGYFWETSIGIACLILLLARSIVFGNNIQKISWSQFGLIAACAWPTLIGTALYSLALHSGPLGIVGAIGCGSLVITALLAWSWYNERVTIGQWMSMALILAGIIGLKFV